MKPARWVKQRYFQVQGNRHWVFAANPPGGPLELCAASAVSIIRHVKIRSDANPFNPEWNAYFARRQGVR